MFLSNAQETHEIGCRIGAELLAGDVIMLTGSLGAGKTSLARGIIAGLGFADDVPSPSFPIVIPYQPPQLRLPVWHVDLYRIESASDIPGLGLEEILVDGALIVEWPNLLPRNIAQNALRLSVEMRGGDLRHLTAQVPPSWRDRCPIV